VRAVNMKIVRDLLWYILLLCVGTIFYLFSIMDTLTFLTFAIAVIGILPLVRTAIIRNSDPLSPKALLPFTYTLYALGPLHVSTQFPSHVIIYYLLLQLLGLLAMRLGLYVAVKGRLNLDINRAFHRLTGSSKMLWVLISIIIILMSATSLLTYLYTFGGIAGYIEVGYGGNFYLILREGQIIGAGFEWGLLGAILILFYGLKQRSKLCLFGGIVLFVSVAYIVLLTGRRSQLLYPLLFGVALFHYGYKRIPSPVFAVMILLGITIAQYYALARYFLPKGLVYALSQVWPAIARNPYLVAPWAANEFCVPAASLLEVLHYGGPGLLLGRSYIASLWAPIPFVMRLFSQISFDVNTWRLSTFYPDLLAAGRGLGFSPVTEGYMNFGMIGIFLQLFFYGYIIGKTYNHLLTKPTWSALLLFAGSLPVFLIDGMRINSASLMWRWTRVYLMPWIILIILNAIVPKRGRTLLRSEST